MKAEVIELAKAYLKALECEELADRVLKSARCYFDETTGEVSKTRDKLKEALGIGSIFTGRYALCQAILTEDEPAPVKVEMMRCENAVKCGGGCISRHNVRHSKDPQCAEICYGAVCIPVTEETESTAQSPE